MGGRTRAYHFPDACQREDESNHARGQHLFELPCAVAHHCKQTTRARSVAPVQNASSYPENQNVTQRSCSFTSRRRARPAAEAESLWRVVFAEEAQELLVLEEGIG